MVKDDIVSQLPDPIHARILRGPRDSSSRPRGNSSTPTAIGSHRSTAPTASRTRTIGCSLPRCSARPRRTGCGPSSLRDARIATWTQETGVLVGAFHLLDVAILNSIGLPATLVTDLLRPDLAGLRLFSCLFGDPSPTSPTTAESAATEPPRLALLAWSPRTLSVQVPGLLQRLASSLATAQDRLGLDYSRVWAWRLGPDDLENLRFRLRHHDAALVRELFLETLNGLRPFEEFAPPVMPPSPVVSFAQAQADLRARLQDGRDDDQLRDARRAYAESTERDLVGPLQEWALASPDPVVRNAGIDLATVYRALHQLGPVVRRPAQPQRGRTAPARQTMGGQGGRRQIPRAEPAQRRDDARPALPEEPAPMSTLASTADLCPPDPLRRLRLSAEDLAALTRNGLITAEYRERQGRRFGPYFKLRFRKGAEQNVRYLGRDARRAAEVETHLKRLRTPQRLLREAARLIADTRKNLRRAQQQMQPLLAAQGFRYHGYNSRRRRLTATDATVRTPVSQSLRIEIPSPHPSQGLQHHGKPRSRRATSGAEQGTRDRTAPARGTDPALPGPRDESARPVTREFGRYQRRPDAPLLPVPGVAPPGLGEWLQRPARTGTAGRGYLEIRAADRPFGPDRSRIREIDEADGAASELNRHAYGGKANISEF